MVIHKLVVVWGVLLIMMVSMMTPINSSIVNAGICLVGGILFSIGIGYISKMILTTTSLV